jgi:hypothetical protein
MSNIDLVFEVIDIYVFGSQLDIGSCCSKNNASRIVFINFGRNKSKVVDSVSSREFG